MAGDSTTGAYLEKIAAAYVRGVLHKSTELPDLMKAPLDTLSVGALNTVIDHGTSNGLKIHRFKRTTALPRVQKVLGILKGFYPQTLLDIGSGRGAFLWPLVSEFPYLDITAIDLNNRAVDAINAVNKGGITTVRAIATDVLTVPFDDNAFDAVTALEVLEHIDNYEKALREIIRVSRRFIILSVPSKEDNNPEHIHLLTEKIIKECLANDAALKISFHYVLNHMIAVIVKG